TRSCSVSAATEASTSRRVDLIPSSPRNTGQRRLIRSRQTSDGSLITLRRNSVSRSCSLLGVSHPIAARQMSRTAPLTRAPYPHGVTDHLLPADIARPPLPRRIWLVTWRFALSHCRRRPAGSGELAHVTTVRRRSPRQYPPKSCGHWAPGWFRR